MVDKVAIRLTENDYFWLRVVSNDMDVPYAMLSLRGLTGTRFIKLSSHS